MCKLETSKKYMGHADLKAKLGSGHYGCVNFSQVVLGITDAS